MREILPDINNTTPIFTPSNVSVPTPNIPDIYGNTTYDILAATGTCVLLLAIAAWSVYSCRGMSCSCSSPDDDVMEPAEDTPVTVKNTDYGTNTSQSRAEGPQGIIVNLSGEDYDIDKVEETIIDSSVIENERKKSNDSQKPSGANSSDDGIINPTYARKVLQKRQLSDEAGACIIL
ncbi:MAG: hypothetical protein K0R98_1208 [Rickettsiaceae bacterium]|nr:hypothetical protein [Rickettsiaceae bacterium]